MNESPWLYKKSSLSYVKRSHHLATQIPYDRKKLEKVAVLCVAVCVLLLFFAWLGFFSFVWGFYDYKRRVLLYCARFK